MFERLFSKVVSAPFIISISASVLIACGGGGNGNGDAVVDTTAPTATITFPTANSLTEGTMVTVHGTASDAEGEITMVRVNGVDATSSDNFANWKAVVPLIPGTNTLQVETADMARNSNANAAQAVIRRGVLFSNITDFVLDEANNRMLAADSGRGAVLAVDLSSGVSTIISDSARPDNINMFSSPRQIVLDSVNNRAFVLDSGLKAVLAMDLTTGKRTVISDNSIPQGGANRISSSATGLVLDSVDDRLLLMDGSYRGRFVLAVDPGTGARTIISSGNIPDSNNPFNQASRPVLDSINNQLLVGRSNLDSAAAVLAMDLEASTRTIISDNSLDMTNPLVFPLSLVSDSANNRVLLINSGAVLAVNLGDGKRSLVSAPDGSNVFNTTTGMEIDNDRLLVMDHSLTTVLGVNVNTGERTAIIESSTPDNVNGFKLPVALVLDSSNSRALILDEILDNIIAVDLTTGARTIIPDDSTLELRSPGHIALDSANNRAYVVDSGLKAVLSVDLTTGKRTVVSSNDFPDDVNTFDWPVNLVLDSANQRLLVVDNRLAALLAVDLSTGKRTIISDNNPPNNTGVLFNSPRVLVLDNANQRVLMTNSGYDVNALLSVNLATGERRIISDNSYPNGVNAFGSLSSLVLDTNSANNRMFVLDENRGAILAVDLSTGERTILSDSNTPDNVNEFVRPTGLVTDSANNRFLVLDNRLDAVIAVQIESGERVILSKGSDRCIFSC